jgi:hypothetical protein
MPEATEASPPTKELTDGDVVHFVPATARLGRAEFTFCSVWKRRKLGALYIYRRQQEATGVGADRSYVVRSGYSNALTVGSWSGVDEPRIWRHWWCREHKCMGFDCYVPTNSDRFTISTGSSLRVHFELKEMP